MGISTFIGLSIYGKYILLRRIGQIIHACWFLFSRIACIIRYDSMMEINQKRKTALIAHDRAFLHFESPRNPWDDELR